MYVDRLPSGATGSDPRPSVEAAGGSPGPSLHATLPPMAWKTASIASILVSGPATNRALGCGRSDRAADHPDRAAATAGEACVDAGRHVDPGADTDAGRHVDAGAGRRDRADPDRAGPTPAPPTRADRGGAR